MGRSPGPPCARGDVSHCRASCLPDQAQHTVSVSRLEMCIFAESEYEAYAAAFEGETRRSQQFADSLGMGSTPVQPWQTGRE